MATPDNSFGQGPRLNSLPRLSLEQWVALHRRPTTSVLPEPIIEEGEFGKHEPFAPFKRAIEFDAAMDALAIEYGQKAPLGMIQRDFPRASEIVREAIERFHLH